MSGFELNRNESDYIIIMPNDSEGRIKNLEDREAIMYGYIDELRAWSKKADERIEQNEDMMRQLVAMNGNVLKLIDAMDDKMDGMDARMNNAGI